MPKLKTIYICENCNYQSPKWLGKCPECDGWNTMHEDVIETKKQIQKTRKIQRPSLLTNEIQEQQPKQKTNIKELDRVLGEGITQNSVILLSGAPGIGKSTLTLEICKNLATQNKERHILYISGEESPNQIGQRAKRMNIKENNISIIGETNLENILETLNQLNPSFFIIDSIQTINSEEIPSISGSINQIRYCTEAIMHYAKTTNTPVLIIGHINKEGNLAGPKILEHLVDTVLLLEGEEFNNLRILRSLKNRFGSTNEIGLFEMKETGMEEVKNASKFFLEGRMQNAIGSTITTTLEGSRPLLIEVQALTNQTNFGYPKRTASGYDINRLQLLLAVIQKHLHIDTSQKDVYINITGGYKLKDPASDLAVLSAIISSIKNIPIKENTIILGEIGLSGEIRQIPQKEKRLKEAKKLGFTTQITPTKEIKDLKTAIKTIFK